MEEDNQSKLMRKIKQDPLVPIGLVGMVGVVGFGVYRFKNSKQPVSASVFFTQLRVAAQTAVIGCMTIGMVYNLGKTLLEKVKTKEN